MIEDVSKDLCRRLYWYHYNEDCTTQNAGLIGKHSFADMLTHVGDPEDACIAFSDACLAEHCRSLLSP